MTENLKLPDKEDTTPLKDTSKSTGKKLPPYGYDRGLISFTELPKEKLREMGRKGGQATKGISKYAYTKCINCDLRKTCQRAFEEADKERKKGLDWAKRAKENPEKVYKIVKPERIEEMINCPDDISRCVYEIEGRHAMKRKKMRDLSVFTSDNPQDMLGKIQVLFHKLEKIVDDEPSYTKLYNMINMMLNIYKLKFGEKSLSMSVHKNSDGSTSMDIKAMMKQMQQDSNGEKPAKDEEQG